MYVYSDVLISRGLFSGRKQEAFWGELVISAEYFDGFLAYAQYQVMFNFLTYGTGIPMLINSPRDESQIVRLCQISKSLGI